MAIAAGAMALLRVMTRGALRLTKHLSPWKSKFSYSSKGNPLKDVTGKNRRTRFTMKKGITSGGQLRPWAKSTLSGMKKVGFSKEARTKTLYGYSRATKHIAKNKKLYGAAAGGAAAWDILDKD